jgi:hypothetical protein
MVCPVDLALVVVRVKVYLQNSGCDASGAGGPVVALRLLLLPSVGIALHVSNAARFRGLPMRGDVAGTGFGGGPGVAAVHEVRATHSKATSEV